MILLTLERGARGLAARIDVSPQSLVPQSRGPSYLSNDAVTRLLLGRDHADGRGPAPISVELEADGVRRRPPRTAPISGVVPISLPSRNTFAPVGRESTASAPVARPAVGVARRRRWRHRGASRCAAVPAFSAIATFIDCAGRDGVIDDPAFLSGISIPGDADADAGRARGHERSPASRRVASVDRTPRARGRGANQETAGCGAGRGGGGGCRGRRRVRLSAVEAVGAGRRARCFLLRRLYCSRRFAARGRAPAASSRCVGDSVFGELATGGRGDLRAIVAADAVPASEADARGRRSAPAPAATRPSARDRAVSARPDRVRVIKPTGRRPPAPLLRQTHARSAATGPRVDVLVERSADGLIDASSSKMEAPCLRNRRLRQRFRNGQRQSRFEFHARPSCGWLRNRDGRAVGADSRKRALQGLSEFSAVANRSSGFSASARANAAAARPRRRPRVVRARPPHRRRGRSRGGAQSNSCISAARLNTSARRSQSPPAIRSGARIRTPDRRADADLLERARDAEPVRRMSSADSSTSRGCSAPWTMLTRRGTVERARQLRGHAQRVGRRAPRRVADDEVERFGGDVVLRRGTAGRRRCRRPAAPQCRDASVRRRSDVRSSATSWWTRSGGRSSLNSLTATSRSRSGSYARNTGPRVPHRSDEEHETDRTRQEAQCRQLPCSVMNSSKEGASW